MASIFISHSRQDQAAAERVRRELRSAGFGALFVDFDPEQGIPAGRNWERELAKNFREVGFTRMTSYARLKGVYLRCPLWLMTSIESLIAAMPHKVKAMSAVQGFLGLVLVGQKR